MNFDQMWDMIESCSCVKPSDRCSHTPAQGWETVRVFVSSTFDDFHSEREVLVKKVFPELREWCEARGLCLTECDLRWGIPRDTPSGKILSTCLGELERCYQDTHSKPLMVILLGERVGWIPDVAEVPQDVIEQFHWVPGMSVTGMEIIHGAYRTSNPNAAFCMRDPSFLELLPQQDLSRYQEKGRKAHLLQSLKEHVCHRFPAEQIFTYKCQILGTNYTTGIEKVRLGFSDDFSSWILNFLQSQIMQTYPGHSVPLSEQEGPSWEQAETFQHQLFLRQKSQIFIGRELEVLKVLEFLKFGSTNPQQQLNSYNKEGSDSGDSEPRIPLYHITAEPGIGKSSLLAASITQALELPKHTVFYHFIGCCPSSAQLSNLVMRLCCHLMPAGPEREDVLESLKNCERNEEMKEILRKLLVAAPLGDGLCIFIDAINQLSSSSDVSDLLSWLSTGELLPPSCRCVISSIPSSFSPAPSSPYYLHLEPLSLEAARSLAVIYLSHYSKALSPEQLHLLLQNTCSLNPLWLSLACEELRVFGVFETLTQKIAGFPNTLQGLLGNIIQRLVQEDQAAKVKELLCLVHCCPEGVAERDLQGALSELEGGEQLPAIQWATLHRTVSSLLRVGRDHRGRDTLSFFHGSVAKAVEQCLLGSEGSRQPYLSSLANYYEHRCTDDVTVVFQLPRLLQEANLSGRLVQFLRKDSRAQTIQAHTRAQYLKALRCTQVCRDGFPRSPALICPFCSLRTGAFGHFFLNSQSCAVCGSSVNVMGKEAFLCHQHFRYGRNECLVCKSPILGPQAPSPALLCHYCGFFQTCVAIKT
ncbi:telomerase protein component 1-like [Discoglossus pictus]